jgi:hypothetical protein
MEKYFLIDTDQWVWILKEDKKDYLINCLQQLTADNRITLLVPSILQHEWKSEKKKQIEYLKKIYSSAIDVTTHAGSQVIGPQLHNELVQAERKVEKIDNLLEKGIAIEISNDVKSFTIDRSNSKEAPFHNNPLSYNDCQFYFSAIEYLKQQNQNEVIFVTRNCNDFGKISNKTEELHPDLIVDGIETYYFTDLGRSFAHFNQVLQLSARSGIEEKGRDYNICLIEIRGGNALEQLHKTLLKAREQLEIIPTNILARMIPFRIKHHKGNIAYYSGFAIHTNNDELFDMFDEMVIGEEVRFIDGSKFKNTAENVRMATEIIQMLNANQVFLITSLGTHKEIDIQRTEKINCSCTRCSFGRLQLSNALAQAEVEINSISEMMKSGFVYYQLGFYDKAIKLFYQVYTEAKAKNLHLLRYRAAYNLFWLKHYALFYKNPEMNSIGVIIQAIDLNKEYNGFANASEFDQSVASFFHNTYFHYHYSDDINELADKISNHFEIQLGASYSNNSNYWNLVCTYSEFELFIRGNCLTFSKFSNFSRVFSKYREAVFLSLNLNQYQDVRPVSLNDYNLSHLVLYGNPEGIAKSYHNLSRNLIQYEPDRPNEVFKTTIENFFADSNTFLTLYREKATEWNDFMPAYETILCNILSVLTIVDFDEPFLKKTSQHIFSFLKNNTIRRTNLKYIGWYIQRVRTHLSKDELNDYFKLFVEDKKFHYEDLFYALDLTNGSFKIDSEEDFDKIISNYFERCPKCGNYHSSSLYSIYNILSPNLQKKLGSKIEKKLSEIFDIDMYYNAVLRDIIEYKKLFPYYIELFKPLKEKPRRDPFFGRGEITYPHFNELMNIVFKLNIRLPKKFVTEHMGMSDYYDWLIDMKAFDYSKFNPLWVIQYATIFYLKRIFKVPQVRKKIKEFLRKNYQPTLSKLYASYV